MNVAIYMRVSTEEQRERQSIATQRDFAERHCAKLGIGIAGFYADDGISGTVPLEGRPEGRRLLEDARSGEFEEVLVYKLDRLGREPLLILTAVQELKNMGVAVRSMNEPFETGTPAGRFMLTMLSGAAGFERDSILQRSAEGIGRLVREGAWVGGVAPYGYRVEGRHRDARLVISDAAVPGTHMTESDVIRLIYRMAGDEGKSCFVIAEHLNQLGVPAAGARNSTELPRARRQRRTCSTWRDSRIQYMLTSSTYKGLHVYGKRPNNPKCAPARVERPVPPIVDAALWTRTQEALKRNRFFCKRNSRRTYLLRGITKCGHCGWTYIGTVYSGANRPTRKYYVCGGRHKGRRAANDPADRCTNMAVTGDLENLVWDEVERFLRDPGDILAQLGAQLRASSESAASVGARLQGLKTSLASKDDERARVLGLFRRGRIDDATLDQQLEEIDSERTQLLEDIQKLECATERAHSLEDELVATGGILGALRARLDSPLTEELKRQLIQTLVAEIKVETVGEGAERDSQVTITYRFGVPGTSIDPGLPRGIRVLQTLALPLGYAAPKNLRGGEL